ncbi:DUF3570 domain-containing protein [Rhizobacter sp. AJA081-3]|uniref:DUF3570 domain-containing protein n=1 Tax=Rhizobacter sp. AJA081-3 TaxID=2753607 RepID=UPI001AE0D999|nr:DUF3570 domain-containing protein [Rhizobacter sp. AJA081-3]QTN25699.1 DUF3570 domain-containing protein [Rhizobacter sp. AJA081-3]
MVGSIVLAAMALPGVAELSPAHAESRPDRGTVSVRLLGYQDWQPGLRRTRVLAPAFRVQAPVADDWAFEGGVTADSVSGASPRYHAAISGASRMSDQRRAGDLKVTRYTQDVTVSAGIAGSSEHDYQSRAGSLEASWSSADRNTTLQAGVGASNDRIDPVNGAVVGARRRTRELSFGITRALTRADLVQATVARNVGAGYYSDPYKLLDERPDARRQTAVLLRWNHHFESRQATVRTSYRAYQDSFGIRAHSLEGEWLAPITRAVGLQLGARLHSQTAASFYVGPTYDPALGAPYPLGYDRDNPPRYITVDQRLSAFGAVTLAMGLSYAVDPDWTVDSRFEFYQQRTQWANSDATAEPLPRLRAVSVQLGVSHRF